MIVDELEVDDQGDDDDVDVDDVVGELELDDQGRALLCEHRLWCGRGRKLQVELTR